MTYTPSHHCTGWPCPICYPPPPDTLPYYYAVPIPPAPQGCICPPTSERTCKNTFCPRGGGQPLKIT